LRGTCVLALLAAGCAWDPPTVSYVGKSCSEADPCPQPLVCQANQCAAGTGGEGATGSSAASGTAGAASSGGSASATGGSSAGAATSNGGEASSSGAGASSGGSTSTGASSSGSTGGSSGGSTGSCGCTPGQGVCEPDGVTLDLCVAPPDGGCGQTTTIDCADGGLACGAGACLCPPNKSGTFYVDPNQGGHADGGLASNGLQEPAACRLRTLTEALALAGSVAPATVVAFVDVPDGGPDAGTLTTFSDVDGGEETFPLVIPPNVTLETYEPPGGTAPYVTQLDVGSPAVSCAVTSSGQNAAVDNFSISVLPSAAGASALCCSGGSLAVNGVQAYGPSAAAAGAANGFDVSGGCQVTFGAALLSATGFPGNGLCLEASAGACTGSGTLWLYSNGQAGIEIFGGSLSGQTLSLGPESNGANGVDVRGGTLSAGGSQALETAGNAKYGLSISGAASSVSLGSVSLDDDAASGSGGEVSLSDGTLTIAGGVIGSYDRSIAGPCVDAAGSSSLSLSNTRVMNCSVGLQLEGAQAMISSCFVQGSLGVGVQIGGVGSASITSSAIESNGQGGVLVSPLLSTLSVALVNDTIMTNMGTPPAVSAGLWFEGTFGLTAFSGNQVAYNFGDQLLISAPGNWVVAGSSCTQTGENAFQGAGFMSAGVRVTVPNANVDAEYDVWTNAPPVAGVDYAVDAGFSTIDVTNSCGTNF
jgi:hypothetical protein